ncbi:hypothetical protein R0K05_03175 [Planococcus sp. SIMBA_160]
MPVTNEEKYLKSIDGTLKDILKELKRQGRENRVIELDGKVVAQAIAPDLEMMNRAQKAMRGYQPS